MNGYVEQRLGGREMGSGEGREGGSVDGRRAVGCKWRRMWVERLTDWGAGKKDWMSGKGNLKEETQRARNEVVGASVGQT